MSEYTGRVIPPGRMTETEVAAADRALARLRDAASVVRS